jgi:hypothetical protein
MYLGFLDDVSFRWSPNRAASLDLASRSGATVVRTIVRWDEVARTRPRNPGSSWDPAYNFRDVDELVVNAQQRGLEVLLTLWGTPRWANGGAAPSVPPARAADLAGFARAVADRYDGLHAGHPFVRFYSIWNEPNSRRFLEARDRAAVYARLARAGRAGVKLGSPQALVAVGETAARQAPAAFMAAVARAAPDLRFDAWAHHPYPPTAKASPDTPWPWPSVGLKELGRFQRAVGAAFRRPDVPVWVTEYAQSTTAVSPGRQAADLRRAIDLARGVPYVDMFVWLMLRDHRGEPWQSGLVGKPGYAAFRAAAAPLDPRNADVDVDTREAVHLLRVPALELRWHLPTASVVGVTARVGDCSPVEISAKIGRAGWVVVPVGLRPQPGVRYRLDLRIADAHGFAVQRTLELTGVGPQVATDGPCPAGAAGA